MGEIFQIKLKWHVIVSASYLVGIILIMLDIWATTRMASNKFEPHWYQQHLVKMMLRNGTGPLVSQQKALWLDIASHVKCVNQSECIIPY